MRSMGAGVRAKKFGFIPVKVPCPFLITCVYSVCVHERKAVLAVVLTTFDFFYILSWQEVSPLVCSRTLLPAS